MESSRFDALVRETFQAATRRGVVRVGIGALPALAFAGLGLTSDTEAKKKKKRKKKKRCKGNRPVTCGKGCCPSNFNQCCQNASDPVNTHTCNPPDFTCCSLEEGGGSCPPEEPQCCPPSALEPFGSCAPDTFTCCPSDVGGACPEEFPVCCLIDPEDPFSGNCCGAGETCCLTDDDCEGADVCDEFFCCVPEITVTAAGKNRSNKGNRRAKVSRFYKKAK